MSALDKQVGGEHYKQFPIQPVEFCYVNNIPYLEATAIKYLCRWKDKGGLADLDKAIHFIELLKEFEGRKTKYHKDESFFDSRKADKYLETGHFGLSECVRPLTGEKNVTSTL
jgi:hypothetical protein